MRTAFISVIAASSGFYSFCQLWRLLKGSPIFTHPIYTAADYLHLLYKGNKTISSWNLWWNLILSVNRLRKENEKKDILLGWWNSKHQHKPLSSCCWPWTDEFTAEFRSLPALTSPCPDCPVTGRTGSHTAGWLVRGARSVLTGRLACGHTCKELEL